MGTTNLFVPAFFLSSNARPPKRPRDGLEELLLGAFLVHRFVVVIVGVGVLGSVVDVVDGRRFLAGAAAEARLVVAGAGTLTWRGKERLKNKFQRGFKIVLSQEIRTSNQDSSYLKPDTCQEVNISLVKIRTLGMLK